MLVTLPPSEDTFFCNINGRQPQNRRRSRVHDRTLVPCTAQRTMLPDSRASSDPVGGMWSIDPRPASFRQVISGESEHGPTTYFTIVSFLHIAPRFCLGIGRALSCALHLLIALSSCSWKFFSSTFLTFTCKRRQKNLWKGVVSWVLTVLTPAKQRTRGCTLRALSSDEAH